MSREMVVAYFLILIEESLGGTEENHKYPYSL
jgi:hypothetical protein